MFMVSMRLSRIKVVACSLALILAVSLGIVGVRKAMGSGSDEGVTVKAAAAGSADQSAKVKKVQAKNNGQRVEFARSFGWEVEEEPSEMIEVIIPQEFDQVYQEYNAIQKKQGMDLSDYAGKRVKRYTFTITNYPGGLENVQINILIYKNKIIGGDVCSLAENGFMHGFNAPA